MRVLTLSALLILVVSMARSQTPITISSLRATAATGTTYFITDAGREGLFYFDPNDRTTADNGGTVIVSGGTKRYKRSYSGALDVRWFGGVGNWNGTSGTDNAPAINAAINAATRGQVVMIPAGSWYVSSTIALPLVTTKKVGMEIYGSIFFARGSGFILEGPGQDFRCRGSICGGSTGATTESAYAGYVGTGIYLKNALNCRVEVNEIYGFKYGIEQAGDKLGGAPAGSQYNTITFNNIHHNYVQIKIAIINNSSESGNWSNETFWYGGQLGNGVPKVTYGAGGTYGLVIQNDPGATPSLPIGGHVFHNVGFEGLDKAVVMKNCSGIAFLGGGLEPDGVRSGFDLDPVTCVGTKFVGFDYLYETDFVPGRLGMNTEISATPFWIGPATGRNYGGNNAIAISASRWRITAPKYSFSNFTTYNANDLTTISGPVPTLQAMTLRQNGVTRSVPFKSTFLHVTGSTAGSPITLPLNIGCVRVEATEAKVFKVDSGDLVQFGEGFFVEYVSSNFPISFVRADNGALLIPSSSFTSAGTYRCTWAGGTFRVAKLSSDYKTFTQTGPSYVIADGIATHFVSYQWGACTTTLPSASTYPGRVITIKNLQAAYSVTVNGVATGDDNVIQGRGAMTVQSDGTVWNVISFYKKGLTY